MTSKKGAVAVRQPEMPPLVAATSFVQPIMLPAIGDDDAALGGTFSGTVTTARMAPRGFWARRLVRQREATDAADATDYMDRTYANGEELDEQDRGRQGKGRQGRGRRLSGAHQREPIADSPDGGVVLMDVGPLHRAEQTPGSYRDRAEGDTRVLTNAVLGEAVAVNTESLAALRRANMYAHAAEEAGLGAARSLAQQRAQLDAIDEYLEEMSPILKRASLDIRALYRGLVRDRVFMCMCCCTGLLLIFVIVVVARKSILGVAQSVRLGASSSAPPPPPAPTFTVPSST